MIQNLGMIPTKLMTYLLVVLNLLEVSVMIFFCRKSNGL